MGVRVGVRLTEIAPRLVLEFVLLGEVRAALEENVAEELVTGKPKEKHCSSHTDKLIFTT